MAATGPAAAFLSNPVFSLEAFLPNNDPITIAPPPSDAGSLAPLFQIPAHIYTAALDPKVPLTIATVYAVTAKALNVYNTSNGRKPWAISKTRPFQVFVVLHNIFLAVYSLWTFVGMFGALSRSLSSPTGPGGLVATVDSMCQLHGPAGLGNAFVIPQDASGVDTEALRSVPGRMWNEGLAFYGWIFYLSKFYEVLDTFIILAKGKLSSTLQTYHHAGAMMCMWAGIRFMAPPIWMFAFVNSGVHAMMYTYYTITAFSIRVPVIIKRTLTTLQITQFLVGATYAMIHTFIFYTVPVTVTTEVPAAQAGVAAAVAAEPTVASVLDSLKKLIMSTISMAGSTSATVESASEAVPSPAAPTMQIETRYEAIPCIQRSGQTFAIWLNVLYLAPLTYLFVKFFITSYIRRSTAESAKTAHTKGRRMSSNVILAEKAGWDAARSVEREVYGEGQSSAVADSDTEVVPPKKLNGKARS